MGLPLKNPVVVAAGPWSGGAAGIQRCIDAGAAAVITETIQTEEPSVLSPRIYYRNGQLLNLSLYGRRSLEEWEAEVERIDRRDSFVIFSIRGSSPSEIAYLAQKTERLGADALQLDIFAPMDSLLEEISIQPEKLGEMTRAVVEAVHIPVMARLPYNISASTAYVRAVERAGVSAISTIESLRGLSGVDVERRASVMPTFGGYTGPHIRPISLAATATLAQLTDCQICSVGGVEDYVNILEFMMLGATAVQLGSVVMLRGYGTIADTVERLEHWMQAHGCDGYGPLIGAALPTLRPHGRLPRSRKAARLLRPCGDASCGLCVSGCMYGALCFGEEGVRVTPARCSGCGLCGQRCPEGALALE